jgi:hypothetical protein
MSGKELYEKYRGRKVVNGRYEGIISGYINSMSGSLVATITNGVIGGTINNPAKNNYVFADDWTPTIGPVYFSCYERDVIIQKDPNILANEFISKHFNKDLPGLCKEIYRNIFIEGFNYKKSKND